VKVRVALLEPEKRIAHLESHLVNIRRTWQHFLEERDMRLGLASLGAELALRGDFRAEHIPYVNPFAERRFRQRYADWSASRIRWIARIFRLRNRLVIPALRYEWIRGFMPPRSTIRNGIPNLLYRLMKSTAKTLGLLGDPRSIQSQ
jgi:hypothetical protein